jgi:hypothetical protein
MDIETAKAGMEKLNVGVAQEEATIEYCDLPKLWDIATARTWVCDARYVQHS